MKDIVTLLLFGGFGIVPAVLGLICIAFAVQPNVVAPSLPNRMLLSLGRLLLGFGVAGLISVPAFFLLLAGGFGVVYLIPIVLIISLYWASLPIVSYFRLRRLSSLEESSRESAL